MTTDIIYDCDGVLLDWVSGFRTFLKDIDGIDTDPEGPCEYNMMTWIGTDEKSFVIDRVNRFNAGEGGHFAYLDPVPGAVEAVEALRSIGFRESVLTACNTDPDTVRGRIANLDRVFGGFEEVTCVDLLESKRPHLEVRETSWFVEDNVANAHIGMEAGHHALLLEYRHNAIAGPDETFRRMRNWKEIRDVVTGQDLGLAAGF